MINYLSKPFIWFFKLEAASGLVLLFAAIIALIISNSGLSELYFSTLNQYLFIGINNFGLKLSVLHWINDALMAIFFFFVTLEIKREFLQGELSNIKQALLPIIAAVGGMLVPALFYVFINFGDSETMNGWAIPSATDIAFSLGVLSLLGKRVPLSLKVFLTALAIIDDLGAIVIIAFFYSGNIEVKYLILMLLALIILVCLNKFNIKKFLPFLIKSTTAKKAVAKSVEKPKVAKAAPPKKAPAKIEKTNYSKMTVGELKAAAKDKGISGYTSLKKAELIAALNK